MVSRGYRFRYSSGNTNGVCVVVNPTAKNQGWNCKSDIVLILSSAPLRTTSSGVGCLILSVEDNVRSLRPI